MQNVMSRAAAERHLAAAQAAPPTLWWFIQNYHHKVETYQDSDGNTKTRTTTVLTRRVDGRFAYSCFRDASPPMPDLAASRLTKVKLRAQCVYGDDFTEREYKRQLARFTERNASDTNWYIRVGLRVDGTFSVFSLLVVFFSESSNSDLFSGMKKKLLCEAEPGARHRNMNNKCFMFMSLLGCSYCFRLWLSSRTGRHTHGVQKQVFCIPHAAPGARIASPEYAPNPKHVNFTC